jgi:hypothetical protein
VVLFTTVSKKAANPACRDIRKLDNVLLAGPAPHFNARGGQAYRDRIPTSLDRRSCTGFVPSGSGRQKKTYRPAKATALR